MPYPDSERRRKRKLTNEEAPQLQDMLKKGYKGNDTHHIHIHIYVSTAQPENVKIKAAEEEEA